MSKKGFLVPVVRPEDELEGPFWIRINGKLDKTEYGVYLGEMTGPDLKELDREFLKKIMDVPCTDLPDGIQIWINTDYELPLGYLGALDMKREGKKLQIKAWHCYDKVENEQPPDYDTVLVQEAMARYSSKSVLRCEENLPEKEADTPQVFVYDTDTGGTVADKYNVIHDLFSEWSAKAKRELID